MRRFMVGLAAGTVVAALVSFVPPFTSWALVIGLGAALVVWFGA